MNSLQSAGLIAAIIAGVVGALTGVGGLTLSIITYVNNRRDKEPHIQVSCHTAVSTDLAKVRMDFGATEKPVILFGVQAVNAGIQEVRLEEAGILLPGKKRLVFLKTNKSFSSSLPETLTKNQKCALYMDRAELVRIVEDAGFGTATQLTGYMRDVQGRYFRSKPFTLEPAKR